MITNQVLTNQSNSGSGQEPTNIQRRTLIGGALAAALLSSSGRVMAEGNHVPNNPFILLLKGFYRPVPVGRAPDNNLGLSLVNLNDGSYSKTRIYPVWIGIPGSQNQDRAIGTFYASPVKGLCAYDLPRGAIAMQFIPGGTFPVVVPDGRDGQFLEGTAPLTILEATGIYRAFAGGHNIMVDKLHQVVAGTPSRGFPTPGMMNSASALSASISSHKRKGFVPHRSGGQQTLPSRRGGRSDAPSALRAAANDHFVRTSNWLT